MTGEEHYAFDNVAHQADQRFAVLEQCYDPVSTARLSELGVGPGWDCLELGAGRGSLGRWLGARVAPSGTVLVTDLDTRWIPASLGDNVTVRSHDLRCDPVPRSAFDLVHARLVLWHLPQRLGILTTLVSALRPGGLLVLEEFDTDRVQVLHASRDQDAELFTRVHETMITLLEGHGGQRDWGTRAYAAMWSAGLEDVGLRIHAEAWPGGSPGCRLHRVNTEQLENEILRQGVSKEELEAFWRLLEDPAFTVTSYPLNTIWGRLPHIPNP